MQKSRRLALISAVSVLWIGCDQVTKEIAMNTLKGVRPMSFFGNLFRLEYVENPGAFLGLGGWLSHDLRFWILTVAVAIFLSAFLFFLVLNSNMGNFQTVAMSMILGGGISNLIDRITRTQGRVVDFMNLGIGNLRTGIFNVADIAIMVGIGLFILSMWFQPGEEKPEGVTEKSPS